MMYQQVFFSVKDITIQLKVDVKVHYLHFKTSILRKEKNRDPLWASQGQAHSEKIDGVDLSGQSMFMLLIRRIPPLLTGEMMRD